MKTRKTIQTVSEKKLRRFVEIIESMEGKPCPSDAQFAGALGYQNESSVKALIRYARDNDIIRKIGDPRHRQLLVTSSRKKTAPSPSKGGA